MRQLDGIYKNLCTHAHVKGTVDIEPVTVVIICKGVEQVADVKMRDRKIIALSKLGYVYIK